MSGRAVVLDMDGTMVDTEPLSQLAWSAVLRPFGYEIDDELQARLIGHRSDRTAEIVLATFPVPLTAAEIVAQAHARFDEILAESVPVRPGLYELIDAIARRGLPWGVATASSRAYAQRMLSRLGLAGQCAAIVGGDEVARPKPAPDTYKLAVQRLGAAPGNCLAVEDSLPGCQAALAAGLVTVAVPGSHADPADFSAAHAVYASLHDVARDLGWLMGE